MAQKPTVYTHGHHESVLRSHLWRTAANSAAFLLPSLKPHFRILDVGCGPGTITADLANFVPDGEVIGLDSAPKILEQAGALTTERGIKNIQFVVGDVHALAFPDASFDVVFAHQVLQHAGDPVHALQEMRRVTKPGGIVAVRDADYSAMTWYPDVDGLSYWRDLYIRVARGNGGEPDAGRRLLSWALQAGFSRDAITGSAGTWCYSTPEERVWWSELWAERTVSSAFADGAVGGGHATHEDLERIASAYREWGTKEDAWIFIVNGEIIARV